MTRGANGTAMAATFGRIGFAAAAVLVGLTLGAPAGAADATTAKGREARVQSIEYRPPMLGAPARRMGASTRGFTIRKVEVEALAPDHVGLTTSAQPTLYWYLSDAVSTRVEITVVADHAIEPLLEVSADGAAAGIHPLSLAEHGVTLAPGDEVDWSVAIVVDSQRRSKDVISTAMIRRVEATGDLAARLSAAGPEDRAAVYAGSGVWYDALDAVSRLVAEQPAEPAWRRRRAELLEQVDLLEAAAFDRVSVD